MFSNEAPKKLERKKAKLDKGRAGEKVSMTVTRRPRHIKVNTEFSYKNLYTCKWMVGRLGNYGKGQREIEVEGARGRGPTKLRQPPVRSSSLSKLSQMKLFFTGYTPFSRR